MELHDAIIQVLEKAREPLTAQEIADRINSGGLYSRKVDDSPVPARQITARINVKNYSHRFTKDKSVKPMLISLATIREH
jgi:hypothetical protein